MSSIRTSLIALVLSLVCVGLQAAQAKKEEVKDEIDPGAEKALKDAGFTEIHGTWKMPKPNVFEVTDGFLASPKTDGTMAFTIDANAKGTLAAWCRNGFEAKEYTIPGPNNLSTHLTGVTGFGIEWDPRKTLVYGPIQIGSAAKPNYIPAKPTDLVTHSEEKTQVSIAVHGDQLQIDVNGKTPKRANYKLAKSGPFEIKIKGTMTLESPSIKD